MADTSLNPSRRFVGPPDVNLLSHILEAEEHHWDTSWLYEKVRNKGEWDYKQRSRDYDDYGNFHYGVVAAASGMPEQVIFRAAGMAQEKAGTNKPEWRHWYSLKPPYGDDPNDREMIKLGIETYHAYRSRDTVFMPDWMGQMFGGINVFPPAEPPPWEPLPQSKWSE